MKLFELGKPLKVATIGSWKGHRAGSFDISLTDMEQMITNFKNRGLKVPIDFEHESLENKKAPAIGWVEELYIQNKELFAKVSWSEEAKELIKNGQYRYISPVYEFNSIDSVSGKGIGTTLHSIALTNTPFLSSLGEIPLKKIKNNFNKGEKMEDDKKVTNSGQTNELSNELQEKLAELEAQNAELVKENEELKIKVAELEAKISELEGENAEELVENSIKQGLVANSQKPWALNYAKSNRAGFKEYLNTLNKADITKQNNTYANSNKPKPKKDLAKMIAGVKDE